MIPGAEAFVELADGDHGWLLLVPVGVGILAGLRTPGWGWAYGGAALWAAVAVVLWHGDWPVAAAVLAGGPVFCIVQVIGWARQ